MSKLFFSSTLIKIEVAAGKLVHFLLLLLQMLCLFGANLFAVLQQRNAETSKHCNFHRSNFNFGEPER